MQIVKSCRVSGTFWEVLFWSQSDIVLLEQFQGVSCAVGHVSVSFSRIVKWRCPWLFFWEDVSLGSIRVYDTTPKQPRPCGWKSLQEQDHIEATPKVWMPCGLPLKSVGCCRDIADILIFSWIVSCTEGSEKTQSHQHPKLSNSSNYAEILILENTPPQKRHNQKLMHPSNAWL